MPTGDAGDTGDVGRGAQGGAEGSGSVNRATGANEAGERFNLAHLEARVAEDPGAPEFPALAEALRRAGRVEESRRVSEEGLEHAPARLAGRVSLGLALLEIGAQSAAMDVLAEILDPVLEPHRLGPLAEEDFVDDLAEDEIDQAFAEAESDPNEMMSANRVAERVLLDDAMLEAAEAEEVAADGDPAVGDDEPGDSDAAVEGDAYSALASPTFATPTMLSLLEAQGDFRGAAMIRTALGESAARMAKKAAESARVEAPVASGSLAELDAAYEQGASEGPDAAGQVETAAPPFVGELDPELGGELHAEASETTDPEPERHPALPLDAAEAPSRGDASEEEASGDDLRSARVVATLEEWLHNLQRSRRA